MTNWDPLEAASGDIYYFRHFDLSSGDRFFYPTLPPGRQFTDPPAAIEQGLFVASHGGGWLGEWWNYSGRPAVSDKVPTAGVAAWLAAR